MGVIVVLVTMMFIRLPLVWPVAAAVGCAVPTLWLRYKRSVRMKRFEEQFPEALDLLSRYDLIVDGSDNFETRYLVSDACYFAKKPLITAAVGTFDGSITTIRAHETRNGKRNPTYRCLFPEPPPPGTVPACEEAGILGALVGVIGSMMALEVIREIVGFGEGLVGQARSALDGQEGVFFGPFLTVSTISGTRKRGEDGFERLGARRSNRLGQLLATTLDLDEDKPQLGFFPRKHREHRFFARWSWNNFVEDRGDWTYSTIRGLNSNGLNRKNMGATVDWIRCVMNIMMDWNFFKADTWQSQTYAPKFAAHEKNAGPPSSYCDATLGFGLPASDGKAFVDKIWSANVPSHDYWNGVLYMLSLLHVSGNFKLYY